VSPDVRAAALADLQAGEQPAIVAAKYSLDAAMVRKWKERHVTSDVTPVTRDVTPVRPTVEAQQRAIGSIVLDLLRAKLEASRAIAEAAKNPAWLAEQPAAELAAFGQWLDSTAFAIGDRLAGAARTADDADAE
jgi:hypothetical protein